MVGVELFLLRLVAATTCFPPTLICIQPNPLLCTLSAATLWCNFLVEQLELKMVSCVLQCAVHCSAAGLEHGSLCTFVYQSLSYIPATSTALFVRLLLMILIVNDDRDKGDDLGGNDDEGRGCCLI